MFETIRSISSSADVGLANESVSRNYEDTILSRGMIILREDIKEKPGLLFCYIYAFLSNRIYVYTWFIPS